ncbi:hypothetical protein Tco_1133107 [Tanacetum coccineum]|uniref:Uncharacterized protein n=1 Tax=Tanacetum coccineum TaxID=301880 RepID=A0ABQ5JEF9_9ASTR
MEDEHLDTIPETESDEFIKSGVENLVPTPSESEDFSDIESECDVPDCDDSQTTNFSTFSNPLFDDSTSSDDESSHEEVIHEMSFKTYLNPLFDLDEVKIICSYASLSSDSPLSRALITTLDTRKSSRYPLEFLRLPLSPVIDTLLPFSSENEDKVFNNDVLAYKEKSPPSSSHPGLKAFQLSHESPMIAWIFEASRALEFCPSFTRASHPQLQFGNPISKSYRLTFIFKHT